MPNRLVRERRRSAAPRQEASAEFGVRRAARGFREGHHRTTDNVAAFGEFGFAPHVAGPVAARPIDHRDGDSGLAAGVHLADGRAGRAPRWRGRRRSRGREPWNRDGPELVRRSRSRRSTAANPQTFFQMYWTRHARNLVAALERARAAGAVGLIAHPRLVFSTAATGAARRSPNRWTSRHAAIRARGIARPRWLLISPRPGGARPDRAQPRRRPAARRRPSSAPTASGCRPRRRPGRTSPGCVKSGAGRSCSRASVASTTPGVPSMPASPRSRCPITAATTSTAPRRRSGRFPRSPTRRRPGRDRAGRWDPPRQRCRQGAGARRTGGDARSRLPVGAGGGGQAGVENVLDIMRSGIDSALLGLGHSSVHDLSPATW